MTADDPRGPGDDFDELRNLLAPSDVDDLDVRGDPDPLHDGDDLLQPDLAAFRDELRAFADRPAPAMSQDLARFVAGLGGLPEPVPEASRRKRPMILQHLSARLVAGGVAAVAMFSGLAVAGALPDGVQSAVSSAGDSVGVGLPRPEDDGSAREVLVASGASSSTPTTDSSSSSSSTSSSAPTSPTSGPVGVTPASTPDSTGVTGASSPATAATCTSTPTTTPSSEDRDGDDDGCDDTTSTSGPDTSGPSTSGPEAGDDHGGDRGDDDTVTSGPSTSGPEADDDHGGDRDRGGDDDSGPGSDDSGSGSGSSNRGSGSDSSGSGSGSSGSDSSGSGSDHD